MAISKARRKSSFTLDGSPIIQTEPANVELAPVLNETDSARTTFRVSDPGGFNISYDINYLADSSKQVYTNDSSNLPPHLLHPAQITTATDSAGTIATYRFLTRADDSDGSGNSAGQKFFHKYIASDGLRNVSSTKSFQFNFVAQTAEVLIVGGGGGGGGWAGGGGGAGALRYYPAFAITEGQAYTLTIGTGGQGATAGSNQDQADGGNSVWGGFTAGGGGYGGCFTITTKNPSSPGVGSSGGGGYNAPGGSNPGDYGNAGGAGISSPYGGGGGGGYGGAGVNANGIAPSAGTPGGHGGTGYTSTITGASVVYAQGGGGGIVGGADAYMSWGGGTNTTGGRGGGTAAGEDGTANTGSGGGGGGATGNAGSSNQGGGAGADGVCIIAYPNKYAAPTISAGLTYTQLTSRTGYKVFRFTAGNGTVTFA